MSELDKINNAIKQCDYDFCSLFEGNKYHEDIYSVSNLPKWDSSLLEVMSESELISRYEVLRSSLNRFRVRRGLALEEDYMNKLLRG